MPIPALTLSALIWIAFTVYWSVAARNSARTVGGESVRSRQFHQLLLYGALLLPYLRIPGLTGRWVPATTAVTLTGFSVQGAFLLLALWARRFLGRNWSAGVAAKAEHQLVRSGPYRFVRNPIYAAILGMLLGTAMISGEVHALAGVVVLTVAYVRKIRLEERTLRALFGAEYDEYRRRVRALIPWVL